MCRKRAGRGPKFVECIGNKLPGGGAEDGIEKEGKNDFNSYEQYSLMRDCTHGFEPRYSFREGTGTEFPGIAGGNQLRKGRGSFSLSALQIFGRDG